MKIVTQELVRELSQGDKTDVVILDVEGALHLHRLTGTVPMGAHFIPSMVPGGYAQHREELSESIRKRSPRYAIGSVCNEKGDRELLQNAPDRYRALRHSDLNLPAFASFARRPEYILYVRE